MRTVTRFVLPILLGACLLNASGQGWMPATAQSTKTTARLNEAERALVSGSRAEIVRSGMSSRYFDRHFTLVKVVNQPGDRRVVWKFSLNEYHATVTDVLGFYTKDGKRFDTHSVAGSLRATSEIKRTISMKNATRIMKSCIGAFANPSVEYRASGNDRARLTLTAEAVSTLPVRDEPKPSPSPSTSVPQVSTDMDEIKRKGKKRPPIIVGVIDLESGKCTRGELISGAPHPVSQF